MVRSMEPCTVGVREFKKNFLSIAISNETGALKTQVAKMILGEEFLEKLVPEARQKWTQLYGQTVAEYLRQSIIENLGRPLYKLIRHLETEYIRHCIPSNVASGLSSLPLPYMYVDEIAKSDQPTTQELPSRDRLSGAQTYLKLISVFTTLVVSPEKLKHISQEKLDELSSHVSVT
ncbi:hypothetical protein pdam_00004961 [Pocillopora damicornis]|uniref:Uncharacterized protein n=1 Tax=Pocillopora damicornis TaxID=46731 RepID=A0A3M6UWI2_POCDA|nr:hypothetical protein pdam_00004961 [Pocillopora damicornis]